jgi:hypothetical protein
VFFSIFHSKFMIIQEILVSDWIIMSAHAQTDCLQMRSPALSKWQDLALYRSFLASFPRDWLNPLFTNSVKITQVMNMESNQHGSPLRFGYNFWLLLRYFSSRNACEPTRLCILCIFITQYNGEYKHHLWSLSYWYTEWTYYLPIHLSALCIAWNTIAYMQFKNDIL